MAKRKKGSKTVPKGKAPLGELPLPCLGGPGRQASSHRRMSGPPGPGSSFNMTHTGLIGRKCAHNGASPSDAESPSKTAMPPVTATSEESQASKGRVKSQASINGGGMDTAKQMKRDNEISKGILFKTPSPRNWRGGSNFSRAPWRIDWCHLAVGPPLDVAGG
jgi:hypothetical protein